MEKGYEHLQHRGVIALGGYDIQHFLQSLITNDIRQLQSKPVIYSCLLTPQGKFLYDFFVFRHKDEIWLDCSAAHTKEIIKRLTIYSINTHIEIHNISSRYAVFWLSEHCPVPPELGAGGIDPRNSSMGARVILEHMRSLEWLKSHGFVAHEEGYDKRRYMLAVPEGNRDILSEKHFPHELGLEYLHAIDYHKGCYVGQEVTTRTKHRGKVRKKPYKVISSEALPPFGSEIMAGSVSVGMLCSSHGTEGLAIIRDDRLENALQHKDALMVKNIPITIACPEWYGLETAEK